MRISELRKDYQLLGLHRADLDPNPLEQFRKWLDDVLQAGLPEPNAMTLATADRAGKPSARIVLLKGLDERGFIFYTNYQSRKARELSENPEAALVFYWEKLERQVCAAGRTSRLTREESAEYFKQRPRVSQLGAWASTQSEVLPNRAALEEKMNQLLAQYPEHSPVPLPPFWGGYVLRPERIEFWQGRPNRLHDRFCYTRRQAGDWTIERLSP